MDWIPGTVRSRSVSERQLERESRTLRRTSSLRRLAERASNGFWLEVTERGVGWIFDLDFMVEGEKDGRNEVSFDERILGGLNAGRGWEIAAITEDGEICRGSAVLVLVLVALIKFICIVSVSGRIKTRPSASTSHSPT